MSFEQSNLEPTRREEWRVIQGAFVRHPAERKTFLVTADGLAEVGTGLVHSYPLTTNGYTLVALVEPPF